MSKIRWRLLSGLVALVATMALTAPAASNAVAHRGLTLPSSIGYLADGIWPNVLIDEAIWPNAPVLGAGLDGSNVDVQSGN
jgi:hypothetical protein